MLMLLQTGRKESSLIKTATETGLIWGMQPGREAGPAAGGRQGDLNKGSQEKQSSGGCECQRKVLAFGSEKSD